MPKLSDAQFEARRVEILQAAFHCFSRRGFDATAMAEIAQEAGVAVGTLYSYFQNKRDLIGALSQLNRDRTEAFLDQFLAISDPVEAIQQLIETSMEMMTFPDAEAGLQIELHLWASAVSDEQLGRWIRKQIKLWEDALAELVRRGQTSGSIDKDLDPKATARVVFSLLNGLSVLTVIAPGNKRDRAGRNEQTLKAVRAALGGLRRDSVP